MTIKGLPLLALLLAGCLTPAADLSVTADDANGLGRARADLPIIASAPTRLTVDGPGFEPSLDVGPDGTIYAAAAKSRRPNDGARLADWLWYSRDGGATWRDLPSPQNLHRFMPGLEGDTAVDAKGRFYFSDTWLYDNSMHRWSPSPEGPRWDWSRPLMPTSGPVDDRPFLTAQGDGIVYLLSNGGPVSYAGGNIEGDPPSSKWLYVSTDGGMTWSLGRGFGRTGFCQVAASPADDRSIWIACDEQNGAPSDVFVQESRDRGRTWKEVFRAKRTLGTGYLAPAVAVDRAGTPYVAWLDDRVDWTGVQGIAWAGEKAGHVYLAAPSANGTWATLDVTPSPSRLGMIHAAAGSPGLVGINFYATADLTPSADALWFAHAVIVRGASSAAPEFGVAPLLPEPAGRGAVPPRDLFQSSFGPDDVLHVVPQRDRVGERYEPADGIRADVFHVAARLGP